MAVCDICNEPGVGTMLSYEKIRQAANAGFNPFEMGKMLYPGPADSELEKTWKVNSFALWQ